ncbi:uncharacterized protein LOC144574067 isoform X1 [Carex rostrata]
METPGELFFATAESDPVEIIGTAFFDDDSNDDSSSKAVKGRDDDKGNSSSKNIKVPVGGTFMLKPKGSLLHCTYCRCTYCRPLTEIFSVRFLACKKLNLNDVYGVILVAGSYPYVIFERFFGDPQRIDSEGYIRLTGPRRAIETTDDLLLTSCLFNSRVKETPRCYNGTMWTLMHTSFDQLMCKEFITDFGPVEVQYAVYRNGAEAILEVTLIDWEGKGECAATEVQIFGTVSAWNNKVTNCGPQSLLFYKKCEEALRVGHGDVIPLPLSRKATVLPLGSTLMVDLCIWHHSSNLSTEGVLVEATVPFDSSLAGEEEKIVCGNRGKIKVKATWKTEFTREEIRGHW